MKKLIALAAGLAMIPAVASAQQTDAERAAALGQCLLDNTTSVEQGMFRNMLVALLEEDGTLAQTYLIAVFAQIQTIAVNSCGAPADLETATWAQTVPQDYLNAMLNRTIGAALQLLNAPPEEAGAPAATPPAPAPITPAPAPAPTPAPAPAPAPAPEPAPAPGPGSFILVPPTP